MTQPATNPESRPPLPTGNILPSHSSWLAVCGAALAGFGLALLLNAQGWWWPSLLLVIIGVAAVVAGWRRPTPAPPPPPPGGDGAPPPGAVFFATQDGNVVTFGPGGALARGILRRADANKDNKVTLDELLAAIREMV